MLFYWINSCNKAARKILLPSFGRQFIHSILEPSFLGFMGYISVSNNPRVWDCPFLGYFSYSSSPLSRKCTLFLYSPRIKLFFTVLYILVYTCRWLDSSLRGKQWECFGSVFSFSKSRLMACPAILLFLLLFSVTLPPLISLYNYWRCLWNIMSETWYILICLKI